MTDAVRNHASYLGDSQAAKLGRFIVPAARLPEFEAAYTGLSDHEKSGWRLSLLAGAEANADAALLHAFNLRHAGARIDAVD